MKMDGMPISMVKRTLPVDYVLELWLLGGEHTIEFKFEPQVIKQEYYYLSVVGILLLSGGIYYEQRRMKKKKRISIINEIIFLKNHIYWGKTYLKFNSWKTIKIKIISIKYCFRVLLWVFFVNFCSVLFISQMKLRYYSIILNC
jgi:hypothetical protein